MTLIRQLTNLKTENYQNLKNIIFSPSFKWQYEDSKTGMPFYSHTLLERPDGKYSEVMSEHTELAAKVVDEILRQNQIQYKFFLRTNVNCVHPDNDVQESLRHVDHNFPHINVILYLSNSGGKTHCGEEFHDPKEDDAILMTGEHWMERPKVGRRIILVNTLYT